MSPPMTGSLRLPWQCPRLCWQAGPCSVPAGAPQAEPGLGLRMGSAANSRALLGSVQAVVLDCQRSAVGSRALPCLREPCRATRARPMRASNGTRQGGQRSTAMLGIMLCSQETCRSCRSPTTACSGIRQGCPHPHAACTTSRGGEHRLCRCPGTCSWPCPARPGPHASSCL